ncbi:helix-turn-helix domain-containing protein [Microbacterium sp. A204]|uniref:helix-turn-helix domain-containing protein n=1 Tax=Microbacterium sp. A204 TaxID=3457321 RepID=UPI003FD1690B
MTTNKQLDDEVATWLTPGVAAAALGVDIRTVSRLADRGEIRAIRPTGGHRRYAEQDIAAIIAREPWDAS